MDALNMISVFAGKVRKTGFFQKAGFPGNSERILGIYYNLRLIFRIVPEHLATLLFGRHVHAQLFVMLPCG